MYIISAKHKYEFQEEYRWKYAGFDRYAGSFSTGYPCWQSDNHAEEFETIEEAKEWWNNNNQYLFRKDDDVILDSIAIRKKIYKTIEKLS